MGIHSEAVSGQEPTLRQVLTSTLSVEVGVGLLLSAESGCWEKGVGCWEMLARPLKGKGKRQGAQIDSPMCLILDSVGCAMYENQVRCCRDVPGPAALEDNPADPVLSAGDSFPGSTRNTQKTLENILDEHTVHG